MQNELSRCINIKLSQRITKRHVMVGKLPYILNLSIRAGAKKLSENLGVMSKF
jgi:hypothetical protein